MYVSLPQAAEPSLHPAGYAIPACLPRLWLHGHHARLECEVLYEMTPTTEQVRAMLERAKAIDTEAFGMLVTRNRQGFLLKADGHVEAFEAILVAALATALLAERQEREKLVEALKGLYEEHLKPTDTMGAVWAAEEALRAAGIEVTE